jgi:hypothetical protein
MLHLLLVMNCNLLTGTIKKRQIPFFWRIWVVEYRNWDHFKATIDIESEIADVANQGDLFIQLLVGLGKSILKGPFW